MSRKRDSGRLEKKEKGEGEGRREGKPLYIVREGSVGVVTGCLPFPDMELSRFTLPPLPLLLCFLSSY